MDLYMDEKWKLSKKGSRNASSRREQTATSSTSSSSSAAGGPSGGGAFMKRSSSMPESVKAARNSRPGSGPSTNPRNFTRRCANLVKEQRAKFYIMRRCVTMLICWRDYP